MVNRVVHKHTEESDYGGDSSAIAIRISWLSDARGVGSGDRSKEHAHAEEHGAKALNVLLPVLWILPPLLYSYRCNSCIKECP